MKNIKNLLLLVFIAVGLQSLSAMQTAQGVEQVDKPGPTVPDLSEKLFFIAPYSPELSAKRFFLLQTGEGGRFLKKNDVPKLIGKLKRGETVLIFMVEASDILKGLSPINYFELQAYVPIRPIRIQARQVTFYKGEYYYW